MMAVMPRAE